jgi:hypothetical protein
MKEQDFWLSIFQNVTLEKKDMVMSVHEGFRWFEL